MNFKTRYLNNQEGKMGYLLWETDNHLFLSKNDGEYAPSDLNPVDMENILFFDDKEEAIFKASELNKDIYDEHEQYTVIAVRMTFFIKELSKIND